MINQTGSCEKHVNFFLNISNFSKIFIIQYFIFWRLLPVISYWIYWGADSNLSSSISLLLIPYILTEVFLLLPIIFSKFLGTKTGWLHPLVFPTLFIILLDLVKDPFSILAPLFIFNGDFPVTQYILHEGVSPSIVLYSHLKLNTINFIAIAGLYVGFNFKSINISNIFEESKTQDISSTRLFILMGLIFIILFYFLNSSGGIVSYMSSLAFGRFNLRSSAGYIFVLLGFLPYLFVIWYANDKQILKNFFFISGFFLATILQFIVSGSRSALFIPWTMMLVTWMLFNKKIPIRMITFLAISALITVGILGQIRGGADIDSSIEDFNTLDAISQTLDEASQRNIGMDIGVLDNVPYNVDHLYGTTYIGVISFWVPRSIWPDKPRGAGAYSASLIFSQLGSAKDYSGASYPIKSSTELYWNFSYFGVVVGYILFGIFLKNLTVIFQRSNLNPILVTFFIICLFQLRGGPGSDGLVQFFQTIILLYLTNKFITLKFKF